MARTKIGKDKSDVKGIDTLQKRKGKRNKVVMLTICCFVLSGVYVYDMWDKQQEVTVMQLSTNVTAGDMVGRENVKAERIRKEQYDKELITVVGEDGNETREHSRVLFSDLNKYDGQFYNYYQSENSAFTINSSSVEMQYKNPLIEAMTEGNELYTLKINSDDLDINQLFPSTTLRMRIAVEVPMAEYEACKKLSENKQVFDGSSSILSYLSSKGYAISSGGVNGTAQYSAEGDMGTLIQPDERTQIVSEIILKDIIAVDMQSGSGESIYEVYMALMRMSVKDRIPYLKTSFNNDVSGDFRSRVTPKALDLDLTPVQATRMHEYEEMGYQVKYTIVKTNTSSDMLRNFTEINNQIVEQLNSARSAGV